MKVGDKFEVVKILSDGGYGKIFKIGDFKVGTLTRNRLIECYVNRVVGWVYMWDVEEVKRVGTLTITKLKK